jgi:predicted nucleic acid-binding protein
MDGVEDGDLFLSVLVVGEIRAGIERIRRRDGTGAASLESWLRALVASHEERILPVDQRVAEEWGRLAARRTLSVVDGLLAATALVHGLTLVTRNTRDSAGTGAPVLNPFG